MWHEQWYSLSGVKKYYRLSVGLLRDKSWDEEAWCAHRRIHLRVLWNCHRRWISGVWPGKAVTPFSDQVNYCQTPQVRRLSKRTSNLTWLWCSVTPAAGYCSRDVFRINSGDPAPLEGAKSSLPRLAHPDALVHELQLCISEATIVTSYRGYHIDCLWAVAGEVTKSDKWSCDKIFPRI